MTIEIGNNLALLIICAMFLAFLAFMFWLALHD